MQSSHGHPPFLTGLLAARKLLIDLKHKKISQQSKQQMQCQPTHPPLQVIQVVNESQPIHEQVAQKQRQQQSQSKRSRLGQRINSIGRQLHECYEDTLAYELIFARLAGYYSSQMGIVDRNERLKREGFQLEEEIQQYQHKIRYNYQAIQQNQQNIAEMHQVTQQALKYHLIQEKEKAEIQPLLRLAAVNSGNIKLQNQAIVEQDSASALNINWRSLSQKTAKKPTVRKQRVDDEMAGSMFHSQMYNI